MSRNQCAYIEIKFSGSKDNSL